MAGLTLACCPPRSRQILEHRHQLEQGGASLAAFRQFLVSFVPPFCRLSNNLLDLQVGGRWGGGGELSSWGAAGG